MPLAERRRVYPMNGVWVSTGPVPLLGANLVDLSQYTSCVLFMAGSGAGQNIQVEGSPDGTTWYALEGQVYSAVGITPKAFRIAAPVPRYLRLNVLTAGVFGFSAVVGCRSIAGGSRQRKGFVTKEFIVLPVASNNFTPEFVTDGWDGVIHYVGANILATGNYKLRVQGSYSAAGALWWRVDDIPAVEFVAGEGVALAIEAPLPMRMRMQIIKPDTTGSHVQQRAVEGFKEIS